MKGMSGLKILAIDTSAAAASCAVCEDGVVLGESYVSRKLTHSQTILPMVEDLLKNCRLTVSEMDGFAVAAGPGSFTGLRIGISAVKALAFAEGKPAAGVSTLQALAYNLMGVSGIVCAVMDARCGQVYSGVFQGNDCGMVRLLDDDAQMVEQLFEKLESLCAEKKQTVWFVGDGAALCMRRYEALAPAFEARMVQTQGAEEEHAEAAPVPSAEPIPATVEGEEVLRLTFAVYGTRNKLRELKRFLDEGGYIYE